MHCAPAAGPVRIFLDWVFAVDPLCIGPLSLGLCGYFWIGSLLLTIYALGPWCWAYADTLEWVPAVDPICVRPLLLGLSGYFGPGSLLYALGACCWACMDIIKLGPCQRR